MSFIELMQNMAVESYRLDCKEQTKSWTLEQKKNLAMQMSEITLYDGKFDGSMSDTKEHWAFKEVPDRKFSSLKIYAWMTELCSQLGLKIN